MKEIKNVLVTGGTGMIGKALLQALQQKGYHTAVLTRQSPEQLSEKAFQWDIAHDFVDDEAIEWADAIIHLAGAGVMDERWTDNRKQVLRDSRIKSTQLLVRALKKDSHHVQAFIGASAIGYYGEGIADKCKKEEDAPGDDFLAVLTRDWEEAQHKVVPIGIRWAAVRIGIVLSNEGGAFPPLIKPVRYGVGAPLGSGKQYISWIHVADLVGIFIHLFEHPDIQGPYNGVSPQPVIQKDFLRLGAKILHKPFIFPPVPGFLLKLVLGKRAQAILGGMKISCRKIKEAGYTFQFPLLREAMQNLLKEKA